MAAGAALAALGWKDRPVFGQDAALGSAVLTGTHFDLTIDTIPVNFTGRPSRATAVNGRVPGPILRWREGDTVTIYLIHRLKQAPAICESPAEVAVVHCSDDSSVMALKKDTQIGNKTQAHKDAG